MLRVSTILVGLFCLHFAIPALAADRAMIVLDASGSMWGQIDGRPKLEIAREALRTVLRDMPADREVGLVAYGHRDRASCEDIELLVPPAAGTASSIASAAGQLKFLGKTPLSAAVRKAAEDMDYRREKATVIVITDGSESCNADPCAIGKELEQAGAGLTVHVVGFGLTAEEGRQVACLAENTGGRYFQAGDAGKLKEALAETVAAPPEPVRVPAPEQVPPPEPAPQADPAAQAVEFNIVPVLKLAENTPPLDGQAGMTWVVYRLDADGSRGDYVSTDYGNWRGNLPPGDYMLVAQLGRAETEQRVTVEAGGTAEPVLVLNAGTLLIRPVAAPGEGPREDASVRFEYPDGDTTEYGTARIVVPAGLQKVRVRIGASEASETFRLAAGQTVEKEIVVGVGRALVDARYVAGGDKVENSRMSVRIEKTGKDTDASREEIAYGYGPGQKFDLPPGDYLAVVEMDQAVVEQPFGVKLGATTDVTVVLNAGRLTINAKDASIIEVLEAGKNTLGDRERHGYAWADTHEATLPAGDYVVSVGRGDDDARSEVPVTVRAGARAEITVP